MSAADRYALAEFREFRRELIPQAVASQRKLTGLLALSEIQLNNRRSSTDQRVIALPFQVTITESTASNVGRLLLDLDLELRRCAALQFRDSASPTRELQLVDLLSIQRDHGLRVELAVSGELHHALSSQPVDFLITLDWLWDYRYARSRVRFPLLTNNPKERWADIMSSASVCMDLGQSAYTTMTVQHDGSTTFAFHSAGAGP